MKATKTKIKELIQSLDFLPEDGCDDIYYKQYSTYGNYTIKLDFNSEKIEYRSNDIPEDQGISLGDTTTSNFEHAENFVVLECVDRLLEKGYAPQAITLEKKYPLGRNLKGKLDIVVSDQDGKSYLMIECKTWGTEYEKEYRKMIKSGSQLFSYFANDRTVKYLCLYTSRENKNVIEYKNGIVPVDEGWVELANVKEIHDHWNKNFKDNGIFENWVTAYGVEIKALIRGRLEPLTKDDSGRIFNQFAEILRHNVVSDKPNAFNKILNLFICKIIDEDKNENEQVDFQWLEDDTDEKLQIRLNNLYKQGMHRFLDIEVTDFTDDEISGQLANISDKAALQSIKNMLIKLRLQKNPEFAFIEVYDDQSFKTNAHIVREVVELLQPYQFRYGHKQQFLGDFFELLLNTSIKQEAGQFFTPVPICRYIVSSLPIKEFILNKIKIGDSDVLPAVIDFACGTGHFLTEYMDKVQSIIDTIDIQMAKPSVRKKLNAWRNYEKYDWAKEYVYGIDADYRLVKSSKVSSFLNGDGEANIIRANGLDNFILSKDYRGRLKEVAKDNPQDNGQFDILIANPPYSVSAFKSTVKNGEQSFELFDRLTDNSSEIECLFVERMKQLLKVGGYAGIVLPSSILSNSGIYTAAREILLKYFKIIGITELGPSTFMATGTNTIILFLERRPNNDHKQILNAINSFFERPKEMTVLGIEKAFSNYVTETFDGISFDDYVSFVCRKTTDVFKAQGIWSDYQNWFYKLPEVIKLQTQKQFREKSVTEQKTELQEQFYDKVFSIEKDKILYFLLTYPQETVIVKVGEKQAEKNFLGYEFSNRRGHEGIKMLPGGTKLFDEAGNLMNPRKANSYIYNAFLGKAVNVDESLVRNVSYGRMSGFINYGTSKFDKAVNLNKKMKVESKWETVRLGDLLAWNVFRCESGYTFPKNVQGNQNPSDIPFYKVSDMNNATVDGMMGIPANYIGADTLKTVVKGKVFPRSAIIFPKVGQAIYTNKKRMLSVPAVCDNNIMALWIQNKQDWSDKYLLEYMKDFVPLQNFASTANPPSINVKRLSSLVIPHPPLDVQQKIVAEIENVESREEIFSKEVAEKQDKIYNVIKEYFAEQNHLVTIGSVCEFKYGKALKDSNRKRGIYPVYGSNGVVGYHDEFLVSAPFIIVGRKGSAGKVTFSEISGYPIDTTYYIDETKNNVNLKWLYYVFCQANFEGLSRSMGVPGLNRDEVYNIKIPLPSYTEQQEIVAQIEKIEADIKAIQAKLAELKITKDSVLQRYL